MTTANLDQDGINNLRAAMSYSADNARQRANTVLEEASKLEKQRAKDAEDAAIAARLLDQQHADNQKVLNEEASQLSAIIGIPPAAPTPAPASEPAPASPDATAAVPVVEPSADNTSEVPLYTSSQLNGMTNARLQAIAMRYDMDAPVNDGNRHAVIVRILNAQEKASEHGTTVIKVTEVKEKEVSYLSPRNWGGLAWLMAFIGLIVGLIVANNIYDDDWLSGDINGTWSWVFTLLTFVACGGIGFFGLGTLGSYIENRKKKS